MDKFPCKHCGGTGKTSDGFMCNPCQGDGYFDWIENIVGKRIKYPGNRNVAIGYQAGKSITTGTFNCIIGHKCFPKEGKKDE